MWWEIFKDEQENSFPPSFNNTEVIAVTFKYIVKLQ